MIANLTRQPTVNTENKLNKYERFGFTHNPFPAKPSVTIGSPNPTENGSIYLSELRAKEQQKFEKLLIPSSDTSQVRPIVFLMDYATRRGRGIGKTSFLNYQRNRIMEDLGDRLSGGTQVIFATYVLPSPDGTKNRKFWQFCKILVEAIVEQDLIATAIWRLRAFSGVIPGNVLAEIGGEPQKTIGDDKWLQKRGVNVLFSLSHAVQSQLLAAGVRQDFAKKLANFGHSALEFQQHYLNELTDYFWRQDGVQLLFDDLVKVFTVAGFTRGLILVDEMEKIIPPQNTQERRAFAEALRYFFIDGQCENARLSFYGLLLTIHPYLQELLNPHWEAAGLDRFAALSRELSAEYTVYFEPLNQESAIPLAKAYLDEACLPNRQKGILEPFDENALEEALMISNRVPGKFLMLLNNTIEKAIQEGWQTIGVDQVKRVAQAGAPKEPDENDIIQTLPSTQVNLMKED